MSKHFESCQTQVLPYSPQDDTQLKTLCFAHEHKQLQGLNENYIYLLRCTAGIKRRQIFCVSTRFQFSVCVISRRISRSELLYSSMLLQNIKIAKEKNSHASWTFRWGRWFSTIINTALAELPLYPSDQVMRLTHSSRSQHLFAQVPIKA